MAAYLVDAVDWRRDSDYDFVEGFNGARWAWQFLRRNPRYQADWETFIETWRALERDYGRAPNRDFCQWKNDPRAWVPAAECEEGDCRIDRDKVLIECVLGARWGFHKFPPDPRMRDAPGEGRLNWRVSEDDIALLEPGDAVPDDAAMAALCFDLSLPLREQVEQAKRRLQWLQRQRVRERRIPAPKAAAHADAWRRGIRMLDARVAGASIEEMSRQWPEGDVAAELAEAERLRDGGYRRITRLP